MIYEMYEERKKMNSQREIYRLGDPVSRIQTGVGEFYKTKKFANEN